MLIPSGKPLFENVSSDEYYARAAELKGKMTDGCIHIAFPDFDEAIILSGGKAVTAIHEAKRWLTVGDELLEPAENKAIAARGRMSAYQLSPDLLNIFIHRYVKSMVETELGEYMTPRLLVGFLQGDKSTCIVKFQDKLATGYVFLNSGKRAGAVYDSPDGRTYDDGAIKDMDRFKEHTSVTIHFTELSEKYVKSQFEAKADVSAVSKPAAPVKPIEPVKAPEPLSPFPIEATKPVVQSVKPVQAKPELAPATARAISLKLVVAVSDDASISIPHRSRQRTLEALEEGDVAWVDIKTINSFTIPGRRASITLPDGRVHEVALKEVAFGQAENRYIILPRKLRARLSVDKGAMVEVKA